MRLRNIFTVATGLIILSVLFSSCQNGQAPDYADPREYYSNEYHFIFDEIPEGIVITSVETDTAADNYCYAFEIHKLQGPIDLRIIKEKLHETDKPKIENLEVTGLKVYHGRSCKTHEWLFDCEYLSPTQYADGAYQFKNGVQIALIEKQGEPYLRLIIPEGCEIITNKEVCDIFIKEINDSKGYHGGRLNFVVLPQAAAKVSINYKGKTYQSSFIQSDPATFMDEETAALVESFKGRGDLISVYVGDVLYVYDQEDISQRPALKKITEKPKENREVQLTTFTRALGDELNNMEPGALGFCALFDNHSYAGKCIYKNLDHFKKYYDEFRMDNVGLGDKVSSLVVAYKGDDPDVCSVLTVWEDSNFNYGDKDRTKHRMSFIATKEHPVSPCAYLTAIQCIGSSNSWNDRISSISFYFGNFGTYWKNY